MNEQPNWDKINKEKTEQILKSMCINIAFQKFDISINKQTQLNEIKDRIECAREIFFEIKKSKFYME